MESSPIIQKLDALHQWYLEVSQGKEQALIEILRAEVPEHVYNSNAIENSTLSLADTEAILLRDELTRDHEIREVYEAKNLARAIDTLIDSPATPLSVPLLLSLHGILLGGINDGIAGRFRHDKEWVRVGAHLGANPAFVPGMVRGLIDTYRQDAADVTRNIVKDIAYFHAEFETIHPFVDGNGRIGRLLINQQLMNAGYPPIIIPQKNKHTHYYAHFDEYQQKNRTNGFTRLFTLLLMESLHKRIALLSSPKIVRLSVWAKRRGVKGAIAANKAARQTIPAFRQRGVWMIAEDYKE